ncbi:MAG: hypothetical protein RID93_44480, partial [Sandaracinaceae bacterium]
PPRAPGPARAGRPRASATRWELRPDVVRFTIEAPTEGVVVVNEAWLPGWRARVDGERAPVFRANGFVRANPVPAGAHQVVMTYRPESGLYWRQVLLFGWLAVLLGLLGLPVSRWVAAWARRRSGP